MTAKRSPPEDADRCAAAVYKRDTYRVDRSKAGQRRGGFSMHYTRCRCTRSAVVDGLCRQHKTAYYCVLYERDPAL